MNNALRSIGVEKFTAMLNAALGCDIDQSTIRELSRIAPSVLVEGTFQRRQLVDDDGMTEVAVALAAQALVLTGGEHPAVSQVEVAEDVQRQDVHIRVEVLMVPEHLSALISSVARTGVFAGLYGGARGGGKSWLAGPIHVPTISDNSTGPDRSHQIDALRYGFQMAKPRKIIGNFDT